MVCSEITPVVLRGLSIAGVNLGISVGQLISNTVIKGFSNYTDHWAYRGPFAIQLVFCLFCWPDFHLPPGITLVPCQTKQDQSSPKVVAEALGQGS